jgi:integrase
MPKVPGITKKVYPSGKVRYYGAKRWKGKTYTTPVFPSAAEAAEALRELTHSLTSGVKIDKGKMTFEEYSRIFLEKYIKPKKIDFITKNRIESQIRNGLLPYLKDYKLRDIDGEIAQDLHNILNSRYTSGSAKSYWTEFRRMMQKAIDWDYLMKDPTRGIESPPVLYQKPVTLKPKQVIDIMYDESIGLRERCTIGILGFTGMRICECFALQREKIDLANLYILVDHRYTQGVYKPIPKKSTKGGPCRKVILPDLEPILKEYYHSSEHIKWLFPGRGDKPLQQMAWTRHFFDPILKNRGLPIVTPKSLRHMYNKMLNDSNVTARDVMWLMGHKTPDMTFDVYDSINMARLVEVTRHIKYR